MSGRYRETQGKKFDIQHVSTSWADGTPHHRKGPPGSEVFKPLPVTLPETAWRNPHVPTCGVIEVDDTPVSAVPDTGSTFAFLGLALFAVAVIKRKLTR